MVTRAASRPSREGDLALALAAIAFALGVLVAVWAVLHVGFYTEAEIEDTRLYEVYGEAIVGGQLPYRDFALEYPPLALPMFVVPELLERDSYRSAFEPLVALCAGLTILFAGVALTALGARVRRLVVALALIALAPLALGSVVLTRFDLWPAALTAGAVAALVAGRARLGFAGLALGVAAKLYPFVLVPLALAYVARRSGRREALLCAGVLTVVVAAVFAPFVVVAPDGVAASMERQLGRPLQIESLGSSVLLAWHQLFGVDLAVRSSHGSQNLTGSGAGAIALASTALQLAAIASIWIAFIRGAVDPERLVRYAAAVVVAAVALAKVLSPQFLIWLIPLVPLVGGRRGVAAGGLLVTALVLTQTWFPFRYWDLARELDATVSWLVLARNAALVALLVILVAPSRPRHEPARS